MKPRILTLGAFASLAIVFCVCVGSQSAEAAGGVLLFSVKGTAYVNAVQYETFSSPSAHLSYVTVKGGKRMQIQADGIVGQIPFPEPSGVVSAADVEGIISQTEMFSAQYPQYAQLLKSVALQRCLRLRAFVPTKSGSFRQALPHRDDVRRRTFPIVGGRFSWRVWISVSAWRIDDRVYVNAVVAPPDRFCPNVKRNAKLPERLQNQPQLNSWLSLFKGNDPSAADPNFPGKFLLTQVHFAAPITDQGANLFWGTEDHDINISCQRTLTIA